MVQVKVEYGGDEAWHRCMLCLKESSTDCICLHCYAQRQACAEGSWSYADREERLFCFFKQHADQGNWDHKDEPVFKGFDIWSVHYCIMHSVIAFGKDILDYFYDYCRAQQTLPAADKFLAGLNINTKLSKGPNPITKTWNMKATDTFNWFANFERFAVTVGYAGPAVPLVERILGFYKTLYKWEFVTEQDWAELEAYEQDFPVFLDEWRHAIVGDDTKFRNYYHTLLYEVPESIHRKGSAWKYSSDITETYVCLVKHQMSSYTTRGGFKKNPAVQLMQRMAVRTACYSNGLGSVSTMISPYEWKKLDLM